MENNNKFKFTFVWSFSLFFLLSLVILGVNSSIKGTKADAVCPSGTVEASNNSDYCCKNASDKVYILSSKAYCSSSTVVANGSEYSCTKSTSGSTASYISWNTVDWDAFCAGINGSGWSQVDGSYSTNINGVGTTTCSADISVCASSAVSKGSSGSCYQCGSRLEWHTVAPSPMTCDGGWTKKPELSQSQCGSGSTSTLKYYVYYNGNNGTPSKASDYCTVDSGKTSCNVSLSATATRDGYYFNGWSTNSTSCSTGISVGTQVTLEKVSTTYYACWKKIEDTPEEWDTLTATFDATGTGGSKTTRSCQIPKGTAGTNQCTVTAPDGAWQIIHSDGESSNVYCVNPVYGGETIRLTKNVTYTSCRSGSNPEPPSDDPIPPSSDPSSDEPSNDPSTEDPSSQPTSEPDPDENVDENPPTGQIAIFAVWVIAFAAIVYSVWYFKQVREN